MDVKKALEELKNIDESKKDFDSLWNDKFGPDDTVVMTPNQFFKEFEEMKNFNEGK